MECNSIQNHKSILSEEMVIAKWPLKRRIFRLGKKTGVISFF